MNSRQMVRLVRSVGLVPVFDWAALAQRIGQMLGISIVAHIIAGILLRIIGTIIQVFKVPLFLVALIAAFNFFPNQVQWIFEQIGLIQIRVFLTIMGVFMPEIFGGVSGQINSVADYFNFALSALPTDLLDVCQKAGVGTLLGLVTSTMTLGFTMRLYFKVINRSSGGLTA